MTKNERTYKELGRIKSLFQQGRMAEAFTALDKEREKYREKR